MQDSYSFILNLFSELNRQGEQDAADAFGNVIDTNFTELSSERIEA